MNKNSTRIALVDDHVLLRNGLASLIQSFEGYTVLFQADNGKEFIQQLQSQSCTGYYFIGYYDAGNEWL